MKLNVKLEHSQDQFKIERQEQVSRENSRQEFKSVEEMLRTDAQQVIPPNAIGIRLEKNLTREEQPAKSWWQRLWGKS